MQKKSIVDSKAVLIIWSVLLAVTFLASIFILNPTLNPEHRVFSWPQLQMQFAYTAENGMKVLESWGPGSRERYLSVIWIDLIFALSYGPAFALYIRRLGGSAISSLLPLMEMMTNLVETSLEMYWVANHTAADPMNALFLTHSVIATIKWASVPVYSIHMGLLFYNWLRSRSMDVAFQRPGQTRRP